MRRRKNIFAVQDCILADNMSFNFDNPEAHLVIECNNYESNDNSY